MQFSFDVSFDLTGELLPAGVPPEQAVCRLRSELEGIRGAGWVDVAWCGTVPSNLEWLRVYKPGIGQPQKGGQWDILAAQIETLARLAMNDERIV